MTDNMFSLAIAADKAEEKRLADEAKRARRHYVTIYVRSCDTTRDCYCLNTNGFDHSEYDSPWVVDMQGNFERGGKEQPLEHPFLPGEDLEDYRERMLSAKMWSEGYHAGLSGDLPVTNPYLEA